MRRFKKSIFRTAIFILLTVSSFQLFGQKTLIYQDPEYNYKEGLIQFRQKNYITAKKYFLEAMTQEQELVGNPNVTIKHQSQYYAGVCALELFQPDAEKLFLDLINNYETPFVRLAYYQLGRFYFRERDYSEALEWFSKAEVRDDLTTEELAEYKFQLAYCYFYKKKLDEAYPLFNQIKNIKNKYYYPANYYLGYIQLEKGDLDGALQSFNKIKDADIYKKILPFYLAQVYYYKKQYDELINYLSPIISDTELKYYKELNQLLGLAYFEQKKYDKAARYLNIYISNARSVRKEDIYQLGYAYYQGKNYQEAVYQFEQLDNLNDTLGQNALYLLADCYLKTGNKTNARGAYMKASRLDFDPFITENALFNYGKLSYEAGLDQEAITAFRKFINEYPQSKNTEEAKELLTEIFLHTRNYQEAINVIETFSAKSPKVKKAYQEVSFYRGLELFNDKDFEKAVAQFNVSLQNPINDNIKTLSYYWKGESYYQLKDYSKAESEYSQFISLAKANKISDEEWYLTNGYYGLGYSFLKQEKYWEARTNFEQCLAKSRKSSNANLKEKVMPDALLRYADCNFMVKDYQKAIASYTEIVDTKKPGSDYALFQKGTILDLQGKYQEKISTLQQIDRKYPGSLYADDAMFEIGTSYIALEQNQAAIQTYQNLIRDYPKSPYTTRAYLKMGLVYYNNNQVDQALSSYEKVIQLYPASQDAKEALLGIRDISISEGNPDIYLKAAKRTSGVNITLSEQDSLSYLAAETQFTKGNCELAIEKFNEYLDKFSDAYFMLPAHFYRGECLYKQKQYDQALKDYDYVINSGNNRFLEKTLVKAALISFEKNKDYESAIRYYSLLLENASFKENIYLANLGLMKAYFLSDKLEEVTKYAEFIINSDQALPEHITEAQFYLAKVAFNQKDLAKAEDLFKKVAKSSTSALGAESRFRIAQIGFMNGNYKESMDQCFKLLEENPSYEYWRVKTYLLLADDYEQLGNIFQAKATLQSIIDNYKGEELNQQARTRLAEIIAKEESQKKVQIVQDTGSTIVIDTTESIELKEPVNIPEEEPENGDE